MTDREKILKAASQLEDIAVLAKQMTKDLRENKINAYSAVYYLRVELGHIVASLGYGVPPRFHAIRLHYESLLQKDEDNKLIEEIEEK